MENPLEIQLRKIVKSLSERERMMNRNLGSQIFKVHKAIDCVKALAQFYQLPIGKQMATQKGSLSES